MNTKSIFWLASALLMTATPSLARQAADNHPSDPGSGWELIWNDEFDSNAMDTTKWSHGHRGGSTWSRYIAMGDGARAEVNRFEDGVYRSYCVSTPEIHAEGNKEMISGAINTAGKFQMRGGYVEARCKTLPHTGNFPAFWLMPAESKWGWPACGEIDVWEQIDDGQTAYQTLHHAMRYPEHPNAKEFHASVPVDSTYVGCETPGIDAAEWHVYAAEWDADHITFFVDGKETATILNPHFEEGAWTEEVTWPFDKDFYIILNQSVGNGSWAKDADPGFRYQTDFDYVRAYQKSDRIDFRTPAAKAD
ncbi:MAG: glycoside hydrolase family 16 protein [Muribaculaceae bacterium]|nr:glycoside hydrolase family 16 protein [Muribaculaceae bacterium]MDE7142710.1 glycoside hydrolase family 16 protein [Muribaculaceae bacterium]